MLSFPKHTQLCPHMSATLRNFNFNIYNLAFFTKLFELQLPREGNILIKCIKLNYLVHCEGRHCSFLDCLTKVNSIVEFYKWGVPNYFHCNHHHQNYQPLCEKKGLSKCHSNTIQTIFYPFKKYSTPPFLPMAWKEFLNFWWCHRTDFRFPP